MKRDQPATDTIVDEACAWIARLETGELSVNELASYREWMQRSPRHVAEINRLAHLATDLERLDEYPLQTDVDIDMTPVGPAPARSRWSSFLLGVSSVAAVLLVTVAMMLWQSAVNNTDGPLMTPIGGFLEKELSDGSVVRLNTDSRIVVAFDGERRTIHLERGEVYFQVAHDEDRPFVVRTATREVFAVGTAFVVRVEEEKIRVLVTEGRVAVTPQARDGREMRGVLAEAPPTSLASSTASTSSTSSAEALSGAPILLTAGQNYEDSDQHMQPITHVAENEVQRRLAWQRGLFEFTDTPLDEVVEEVSRYTDLTIRFDGEELGDVRFGGIFPTGEVHRLFGVLETSYGITVAYVDESTVALMIDE